MMMAGRLETDLEDELKKDIEKPEFMEKPEDKWTEEEQKLAKEYEKSKALVKDCSFRHLFVMFLYLQPSVYFYILEVLIILKVEV